MEATTMPRKKIVAVVGPGDGASAADIALGRELGKLIAERGWILLSGGRAVGVMDAVNKGAKAAGGLTVGVIPSTRDAISEAVDISCGVGGAGTASEVALALKAKKHVVLLGEG